MEIVYQSSEMDFSSPLLILDASFNPPHRAHYAIAALAAAHLTKTNVKLDRQTSEHSDSNNCSEGNSSGSNITSLNLLLSYSARNADKGIASVQDQQRRSEMMKLFADYFFSNSKHPESTTNNKNQTPEFHWNASIAKSSYPRFVDKCKSVVNWRQSLNNYHDTQQIIFLMGFDTLVRLLDPKYYVDVTDSSRSNIVEQLDYFFKHAQVLALPRGEEDPEQSKAQLFDSKPLQKTAQSTELKTRDDVNNKPPQPLVVFPGWWKDRVGILNTGLIDTLPPSVVDKIKGKLPLQQVSSTTARNAAKSQNYETLADLVKSPQVVEFIKTNEIYN